MPDSLDTDRIINMFRRFALAVLIAIPLLVGAALGGVGSLNRQKDDQKPTLADIVIDQAWYGDPATTGVDVTSLVKSLFERSDRIHVSTGVFSDSARGHHKVLWLKYRLKGKSRVLYAPDERPMLFSTLLDDVPDPDTYQLVSASYQGVDVSKQVRSMLSQGVVAVPVSVAALEISDPAVGFNKTLTLVFKMSDGDTKTLTGSEGENISLRTLLTLKELPGVMNGLFNTTDATAFGTDLVYVPAADNVLSQPGTFTISEGILRPFQLERSIRADFVEHTGRSGSMAMWINPIRGRQPEVLWEEKVTVEPDTDYVFNCSAADISDSGTYYATIVLEASGARTKPYVIEDVFKWHDLRLAVHTGAAKSILLKVWRDVLPYDAQGGAALGLDDIQFLPQHSGS